MPVGLVLEGGGTRGAYTSGVLEAFAENEIWFPVVYGISCGACNALSYISGQPKRNFEIFYRYIGDERYLSVASLRRTGNLFGYDFIFGELAHTLLPFDFQAFFASPVELRVGATDLKSGEAVFYGKADLDEAMTPVHASSALPFVSQIVSYQGRELLDGGCAMPIPLEQSIREGNRRNVVVLTRDASYRKNPRSGFPRAVLRVKYGDYPNFIHTMARRSAVYNEELDLCRKQEKQALAIVVRPSRPILVSRYEKDPEKLREIYEMGVRDAEAKLPEIRAFLKKEESV